jgi:hypothetical protein
MPAVISPELAESHSDMPAEIALRLRVSNADMNSPTAKRDLVREAEASNVMLWLVDPDGDLAHEEALLRAIGAAFSSDRLAPKPHLLLVIRRPAHDAEGERGLEDRPQTSVARPLGSAYGDPWSFVVGKACGAAGVIEPLIATLQRIAVLAWDNHRMRTGLHNSRPSYLRSAWNAVAQAGSLTASIFTLRHVSRREGGASVGLVEWSDGNLTSLRSVT